MTRISPVDPQNADPKAKAQLDGVNKALGTTPNLIKTIAHSPAALGAYLGFGQALSGASIPAALREQIALTVAGANSCDYCASAHTAMGRGAGIQDDELARNLTAQSGDQRTAAALAFAKSIVSKRGFVEDDELEAVRAAGYADAEIVEIVATVAINIFTNYFNHVAQTEVDFPLVRSADAATA